MGRERTIGLRACERSPLRPSQVCPPAQAHADRRAVLNARDEQISCSTAMQAIPRSLALA